MPLAPDPNNRVHALAFALADAIGGIHEPTGSGGEYRDWCAQVLTPSYGVFIRQDNAGKRLEISTMPGAAAAKAHVSISRQWPHASVSLARPTAAQVKDIVRRVINSAELAACAQEAATRAAENAAADSRRAETFAILETAQPPLLLAQQPQQRNKTMTRWTHKVVKMQFVRYPFARMGPRRSEPECMDKLGEEVNMDLAAIYRELLLGATLASAFGLVCMVAATLLAAMT